LTSISIPERPIRARNPLRKLPYSSDAHAAVPELYPLSVCSFWRVLGEWLNLRMDVAEWSITDAQRIARMIGGESARRLYGLSEPVR
jgi:hypothetical protein